MKAKDIINQNLLNHVFVCKPEIEKMEADPDEGMLCRLIDFKILAQGTEEEHYGLKFDFKEFEKYNIPFMKSNYFDITGVPCERWIDQRWYEAEKHISLYMMPDDDMLELANEVGIRVNTYELQHRIECSSEE